MRNFTMISPHLWRSTRFKSLSDSEKTLYLYLLTSEHQTSAGCFRLPDGYACDDLEWEPQILTTTRASLVQAGLIQHDPASDEYLIERFFKHCPPRNRNHRLGVEREIAALRSPGIKRAALTALLALDNAKALLTSDAAGDVVLAPVDARTHPLVQTLSKRL